MFHTLLAATAAFFLGTKLSESESTALFLGAAFLADGFKGLLSLSDAITGLFFGAGLAAGSVWRKNNTVELVN